MRRANSIRIRILSVGLVLVAILLIAKLYSVQILQGPSYKAQADRQYNKGSGSHFNRGSIFFTNRDGELVSAATQKKGYLIALNTRLLEDPKYIYDQLSKTVLVDFDVFMAKANIKDDPHEVIASHVDENSGKFLIDQNLKGVNVTAEKWRYYPGDNLASHVLGFVGYKGNLNAGRYGLEKYYEDTLVRDDEKNFVNFFADIFTKVKKSISGEKFEGDIVTTIEPSLQILLQRELAKVNLNWNSSLSGGVIMDPKSGEIYAMAANPDFNPNSFGAEERIGVFPNPLVENIYEMGSIIKPLTLASAIDSGAISPETKYVDEGYVTIEGKKISNFDGKARGLVDMQEVLNQSLNTGAVFAMTKMGNDIFAKYMKEFQIGEETGIDLPNETPGLISNLDSPRKIEYATASFGQGIAMSPIGIARALSALANDGVLPSPHIVKKINYTTGLSKMIKLEEGRRVLKSETSKEISEMLVRVVDEALLGGKVKMANYSIAAKTGTAQVPNSVNGGYLENTFLHSFFGYFPAYAPRFLVFLFTVDPSAKYASQTLTSPFIDITKFLINYYEIPPDR